MADEAGAGWALLVARDGDDIARLAADRLAGALARDAGATLVLPTGNTPLGLYAELVRRVRAGLLDLGRARLLALDEYAGLSPDDPRLLGAWLDRVLMAPACLPPGRLVRFRSEARDAAAESARMDAAARSQPIDLLVLGLGPNGHLGFNEPGSAFDSPTRVVDLTPASIASNAVYWGGEEAVPRRGYTLGLGTMSGARRTILLVAGAHKAEILSRLVAGPVGPGNPSTLLRTMGNVTVIADRAAASRLPPGTQAA